MYAIVQNYQNALPPKNPIYTQPLFSPQKQTKNNPLLLTQLPIQNHSWAPIQVLTWYHCHELMIYIITESSLLQDVK